MGLPENWRENHPTFENLSSFCSRKKTKLEGILVVWTHPFPTHTVGIMLQSQVWRSFTNQTISNNVRVPTREYANKVVSKALAKLIVIPNIHISLLVIAISWKCLQTNISYYISEISSIYLSETKHVYGFIYFQEMEVSNPWGYPISSSILIGISMKTIQRAWGSPVSGFSRISEAPGQPGLLEVLRAQGPGKGRAFQLFNEDLGSGPLIPEGFCL